MNQTIPFRYDKVLQKCSFGESGIMHYLFCYLTKLFLFVENILSVIKTGNRMFADIFVDKGSNRHQWAAKDAKSYRY